MGLLNINDLKVGMILAKPALNKNGTVILGTGSAVTEKHINFFKAWGVLEVDIDGVDSDRLLKEEMESLPMGMLERIEADLSGLFPSIEGNPIMAEIYKTVRKIRFRQAASLTKGIGDGVSTD